MLKRFILWDYARGTWQYDVMVGIILVFVLLTPRGWFRDQPRTAQVSSIAVLPAGHGSSVFWVEPEPFAGLSPDQRVRKASELPRSTPGGGKSRFSAWSRCKIRRVKPKGTWFSPNHRACVFALYSSWEWA